MKKFLVAGFEPFDGEQLNPSYEAIKALDIENLPCEIITVELPVVFDASSEILIQKIYEFKPDIILMIGQAGKRRKISLERVALNLDDAEIPDNKGITPHDKPISPSGPIAYYATLPIKTLINVLKTNYIPAGISNSAGTYLCNHIFYRVMDELNRHPELSAKAGFIHVPYERRQTLYKPHLFSLDIDIITRAIHLIIETLCHQ